MFWKEIGIILLLLTAVLVFGNLWFYAVESVLSRIKKRFAREKTPPVWHTLSQEEENGGKDET